MVTSDTNEDTTPRILVFTDVSEQLVVLEESLF